MPKRGLGDGLLAEILTDISEKLPFAPQRPAEPVIVDARYVAQLRSAVGPGGQSLKALQTDVEQDPYEALLGALRRPDDRFVGLVADTLRELILNKARIYKVKIDELKAVVEKQERQKDGLSEPEREAFPGRFMLVANKQMLARLQELSEIASVWSAIFFLPNNTLGARFTAEHRKTFVAVRESLTGTTEKKGPEGLKASQKAAWASLVRRRLEDVVRGPYGFARLQGASRAPIRAAMARILRSLSFGYKVFSTKYYNMALMGNPGVGKTRIAGAIGYIMTRMLILFEGRVQVYTPADFVAQFEGQTSAKVKSLLADGLENVVFLDEAYGLTKCNPSGGKPRDDAAGYGIDAVNEMVAFMSNFQGLYMMIVAGYERPMRDCFLTSNEGFQRRFDASYRFTLGAYAPNELVDIFREKAAEADLQLTGTETALLAEAIMSIAALGGFPNSAADVQALVDELLTSVGQEAGLFLGPKDGPRDKLKRLLVLQSGLRAYSEPRGLSVALRGLETRDQVVRFAVQSM